MKVGIHLKFIFYFLTVVLVMGMFAIFSANAIIFRSLSSSQLSIIKGEAKQVDKMLKRRKQEILIKAKILSEDKEILELTAKGEQGLLSQKLELLRSALELDVVEVVDARDNLIFATRTKIPTKDLPYDVIFRDGKKGKLTLEVIPRGKSFEIRAAYPLKKEEEIIGVILLGYELGEEFLKELKYFSDLDSALILEGKVIATTYEFLGKSFPSSIVFKVKEDKSEEVKLFTANLSGKPYDIVAKPLYFEKDGTHMGFLAVVVSKEKINQAVRKAQVWIILITILGVLFALLISIILSRGLSVPILQLTLTATKIAGGNLDELIELKREDELGILSQALSKMTYNLKNIITYQRKQISRILQVVENAAGGNLSVLVEKDRDDEFGKLGDGFNEMIKNLSSLLSEIDVAVKKITELAQDISLSSQEQASAVIEQSGELHQIASSMQELTITAKQIALSSGVVTDEANKSSEAAHKGRKAIDESICAMNNINKTVQETAQKLKDLEDSSRKISKVTSIIQNIADKINLLALNASIEAARAGDAGRGFAVVAEEVRKLAEQSSSFAEDINTHILTIQEETKSVIYAMEKGVGSVEDGVEKIYFTERTLKEIITLIENTHHQIKEISLSTEEQKKGTEQISSSLSALSSVVKDTEILAKKVAEFGKSLKELADSLHDATDRLITHKK